MSSVGELLTGQGVSPWRCNCNFAFDWQQFAMFSHHATLIYILGFIQSGAYKWKARCHKIVGQVRRLSKWSSSSHFNIAPWAWELTVWILSIITTILIITSNVGPELVVVILEEPVEDFCGIRLLRFGWQYRVDRHILVVVLVVGRRIPKRTDSSSSSSTYWI